MTQTLGNSSEEQALLRPIARWAARYTVEALVVFENHHPDDERPRKAIEAAREFGNGKKRDKNLRMLAFAAMKSSKNKDIDAASKYAVQAAVLAASVAYTHTDLQAGLQGVRQARHILGPIVYAALALETAANNPTIGTEFLQRALNDAPSEASHILAHMPPQPRKEGHADTLFSALDAGLREKRSPLT